MHVRKDSWGARSRTIKGVRQANGKPTSRATHGDGNPQADTEHGPRELPGEHGSLWGHEPGAPNAAAALLNVRWLGAGVLAALRPWA